jgi:hypothetical protein
MEQRDGQRDFDFEFGTWKTHLRRLVKPLTGSTAWVEYTGTTVVRKVWDGRANLVELNVEGLRRAHRGTVAATTTPRRASGASTFQQRQRCVDVPNRGEFSNGRGEFYGVDTLYGGPSSSGS